MEVIIEALLEIFGEVIVELICGAIGAGFDSYLINTTKETKKNIRIIVFSIISAMVLTLLIVCFICGKTVFVIATAAFILANTVLSVCSRLLELKKKYILGILGRSVQLSTKLAFCTFLLIKASSINNDLGRNLLIIFTIFGMIVGVVIDSFRIYRDCCNKTKPNEVVEEQIEME